MDSRFDVIIIGAGISGLSLAFYCAREGYKTLVIEKTDRLGGSLHSHKLIKDGKEFWIELGAHTCYNSYCNFIELIEACGINDRLLKREKVPFKLLIGDQLKSIISQMNLLELLYSIPKILFLKKKGQSVQSYYSQMLGKQNYEKTFKHLINAVPSQRTDNFPADLLFKKRSRRKDILKSYTLQGGLQTIIDAIALEKNINIIKNSEIFTIEKIHDQYRILTGDRSTYSSSFLALATPPHTASLLLQSIYPEISQNLSGIRFAQVDSTGIILQKNLTTLEKFAGVISPRDSFYSIVSRDTLSDDNFRGFTFHFSPDITSSREKLKRISEIIGVTHNKYECIVTKCNYVPSLRLDHKNTINSIDEKISNHTLLLTGNYFHGLSIEDCVSRSKSEFIRLKDLANSGDTMLNYWM